MKINFLIALTFLSIIIYANINEMHGIVGLTKRDGGLGCICHELSSSDSVNVWIEGPDTVFIKDTVQLKLFMTGGPAVAGGFNLAAYFGELDSVDTLTHTMFGELTHSSPNPFLNDTAFWNFKYTAPDSILTDTIYSVANSVNLDSIPDSLDQWNFGNNFIVHVIDKPTEIKYVNNFPAQFVLQQNYPNPFNPTTSLQYTIGSRQMINLKVYDLLGKEVATLVNEEKPAGSYEIVFDASELSSGIYYYRLEANGFSQTKKMILLR